MNRFLRRAGVAAGRCRIAFTALILALGTPEAAHAQAPTAVEYFHAGWGQCFVTADPGVIAGLDGGAYGGVWQRTGQTLPVGSSPAEGALPVCRFFSTSFAPHSSHFYTPFAAECELVKHNPDRQYENVAFFLRMPVSVNGPCPADTVPLYRLYNDGMGGAPNHRYATTPALVAQMQAQRWVPESTDLGPIFACTPVPAGGASKAEGIWTGTTDLAETARAIVLDDGTYYILYSRPNSATDAGVFQGTADTDDGNFVSGDGRNFPIPATSEQFGTATPVSVDGSHAPQGTMQIVVTGTKGTRTFTASYVAGSGQPPSLAAVAGYYTGYSGHVDGRQQASFTVTADGKFGGTNPVRAFSGTITPRATVNAFDWTVSALAGSCIFGLGPISGIFYYDAAAQRIHGFAPFDARQDEFFVVGTKQ